MKRKLRLRSRRDFQAAMGGPSRAGRHLVVFWRAAAALRVGVTVSRRVRGAPARNRIRRRLREAARHLLAGTAIRGDIVLIGRASAAVAPLPELEEELGRLLQRLGPDRT